MKNPRQSKTKLDHPAEIYARQAANGEIVVSKWVRLAAQRHLHDLEFGHLRGLQFDIAAGEDMIEFFGLTNHSKGEWANSEFVPESWQQFIYWSVGGWKRRDTTRRFRHVYIEVARKNGKSTMCAGTGLKMLVADGEPGSEVYCAATKKDQAKLVFEEAERMRKSSPPLRKRIESFKNNLSVTLSNSKMQPLGADSDTLDGLNIHCAIVDELHAHKSKKLLEVLETAIGARRQPLIFKITTAGHDRESVCWAERERCTKILEDFATPNGIHDDSVFGFIACIDEDDDWKDEKVWVKANPNLGVSVKISDLREKALKADQQPSSLNGFLRLHLNVWTNAEHAAIKMEHWSKCVGFPWKDATTGVVRDAKSLRDEMIARLAGRDCYTAFDLSSTQDITALLNVFPPENEGEPYICIPYFWLPEDNIAENMDKWRSTGANYEQWVKEGFLQKSDGNVIDYDPIKLQILEDCKRYNVREICFDPWNATQVANDLQKAGIQVDKLVKFPQTIASFAEPTKRLIEKMIPDRQIAHLGNPVLRWMAANLVTKEDNNGNKRPVKKSGRAKIDGMVALIMALGRIIANPPQPMAAYEVRVL